MRGLLNRSGISRLSSGKPLPYGRGSVSNAVCLQAFAEPRP